MLDQILVSGIAGSMLLSGLSLVPVEVPPAPEGGCEDTWAIKINEFLANPDGSDGSVLQEWVELYNTGENDVFLDGWTLQVGKSSFSSELDLAGIVPSGGTFVIGEANVAETIDLRLTSEQKLDLGNASSNADAIRLVDCNGLIADTVVYGGNNTDGWLDDRGVAVADNETAPKPGSGESLARTSDGLDSQVASMDFCDDNTPTPSAVNDCDDPEPGDTGEDTGETGPEDPDFVACEIPVLINEFVPNPDGDDSGSEWIELYNASADTVDLTGWTLEWGTKSFSSSASIDGASIAPGAYFVIGGEFVAGADATASIALGNASSSGDGLRLLCPDESVADTVIYGPNNDDGWIDDTGSESQSLAPKPGNGTCHARIQDGYDTDASAIDFHVVSAEECTQGTENTFTEPMVCMPQREIRINEFLPDPDGTDDQHEWVELVSLESEELRLDGWYLEIAKSSWSSVQFTFPSGSKVDASAFLLVGGSEVVDIDYLAEDLDLGNAGSNGDGIRLIDCEGNVIDTVIYGENNDDALVDDTEGIAVSFSPNPGDDQSAGRYPDGADSDASGEDFALCFAPTPGAPNGNCAEEGGGGGGGGGGLGPGGCGRDNDLDDGADPEGDGCSQVPGSYSSMWGFLCIVMLLRRRRRFSASNTTK